jgi:cobalamin synthase
VQGILMTDPLSAGRIGALSSAYARVLGDPTLRQAEGMVLLGQQVSREANILAFNDVFRVIALLAAVAFVLLFARWLYYRIRGINPLASELAALQKMRAKQANG